MASHEIMSRDGCTPHNRPASPRSSLSVAGREHPARNSGAGTQHRGPRIFFAKSPTQT